MVGTLCAAASGPCCARGSRSLDGSEVDRVRTVVDAGM